MKNHVQPGDVITFPAPVGGVVSGQGVLVGSAFGVAAYDAAAGQPVECAVVGVYRLAKAAGAIAFGAKVYWTGTAASTTASGNTLIGWCAEAAAADADTVAVRLDGTAA